MVQAGGAQALVQGGLRGLQLHILNTQPAIKKNLVRSTLVKVYNIEKSMNYARCSLMSIEIKSSSYLPVLTCLDKGLYMALNSSMNDPIDLKDMHKVHYM